jgi:hypothetical protein
MLGGSQLFSRRCWRLQSSSTGANFDSFRSFRPYLLKIKGTGKANAANAPKSDAPGPTPRLSNIGFVANGKPHARSDLRMVLAATALAAKGP